MANYKIQWSTESAVPEISKLLRVCLALTFFLVIYSLTSAATYTSTTTGGNWNAPGTWVGNSAPTTPASDVIIIATTGTNKVTLTANASCASLTVNSGATLSTGTTGTSYTLGVSGNTSVSGTMSLSGTGAKTFTGDITLNSGAIWSEYSVAAYSFGGSFTNNATTFTASTGVHTFSGTGKTISGSTTTSIPNVAITGTYTNNNTLTVSAALSGVGTLTNGASGVLNLAGSATISNLNATTSGNTVNYTGGTQTIKGTAYDNITFASGNKTTSAAMSIEKNLVVNAGTTLTPIFSNSSFSVNGTTSVSGTLNLSGSGAKTFTGDVTINSGGVWSEGSGAIEFKANLTNNATTFMANTGVHTFSGTAKTIGGSTTTSIPYVTVSGSYTNNGVLTVSSDLAGVGSLTNGSNATLNLGGTNTVTTFDASTTGNTVSYSGSVDQSILFPNGSITGYYNLTLSGIGVKTFPAQALTIAGNLILSGTSTAELSDNVSVAQNLNIGLGTTFNPNSFVVSLGGDFTDSGTYNPGTSTLELIGSTPHSFSGVADIYNLVLTGAGGVVLHDNMNVLNDVTIANGSNLTVAPGVNLSVTGTLTNNAGTGGLLIQSNAMANGSLVHNSNNVPATVQCAMTRGGWNLIASPVSGQSLSDFATLQNSDIARSGIYYGFRSYNESANTWNDYITSSTIGSFGNLVAGTGYAARRAKLENAAYAAQDYVTYTGTLYSGAFNPSVVRSASNRGFNCIGNPYTAPLALNVSADPVNNFMSLNADNFDPDYTAIYAWTDTIQYTTITNATAENYVPMGSGFFVRGKIGITPASFTFDPQFRKSQNDIKFRAAKTDWTGFDLVVTTSAGPLTTTVKMKTNMTDGLDKTYDGGLMRISNNYALFTRLVKDNGSSFAVQCVTDTLLYKIIPVGFDYIAGGNAKFSLSKLTLPDGMKISLEDRTKGVMTDMSQANAVYETPVAAGTSGTGRFFIHLSQLSSGINSGQKEAVRVVVSSSQINVYGDFGESASATLYDSGGQTIGTYPLDKASHRVIHTGELRKGVYVLMIQSQNGKIARKIKV